MESGVLPFFLKVRSMSDSRLVSRIFLEVVFPLCQGMVEGVCHYYTVWECWETRGEKKQ